MNAHDTWLTTNEDYERSEQRGLDIEAAEQRIRDDEEVMLDIDVEVSEGLSDDMHTAIMEVLCDASDSGLTNALAHGYTVTDCELPALHVFSRLIKLADQLAKLRGTEVTERAVREVDHER